MKWRNKFIYRTQLPLTVAKYVTVHKCQSVTTDNLVWILDKFFTMALAYVPPGRVRKLSGLYLVQSQEFPLSVETMNKFQDELTKIHCEYARLRGSMNDEFQRLVGEIRIAPELDNDFEVNTEVEGCSKPTTYQIWMYKSNMSINESVLSTFSVTMDDLSVEEKQLLGKMDKERRKETASRSHVPEIEGKYSFPSLSCLKSDNSKYWIFALRCF